MLTHRSHMAVKSCLALLVRLCILIVHIRRERHLRVYYDITMIGEMQNHIRNHSATILLVIYHTSVTVLHRCLFLELHTLFQSHVLQQLSQSEFTEVTLCLVLSRQRICQPVGTFRKHISLLHICLNTSVKSFHRRCMLASALVHRLLHLVYLRTQWVQYGSQLFLIRL